MNSFWSGTLLATVLLSALAVLPTAVAQQQRPAAATAASGPAVDRQAPALPVPAAHGKASGALTVNPSTNIEALRVENARLQRTIELQQQKILLLEQRLQTLEGAR